MTKKQSTSEQLNDLVCQFNKLSPTQQAIVTNKNFQKSIEDYIQLQKICSSMFDLLTQNSLDQRTVPLISELRKIKRGPYLIRLIGQSVGFKQFRSVHYPKYLNSRGDYWEEFIPFDESEFTA